MSKEKDREVNKEDSKSLEFDLSIPTSSGFSNESIYYLNRNLNKTKDEKKHYIVHREDYHNFRLETSWDLVACEFCVFYNNNSLAKDHLCPL